MDKKEALLYALVVFVALVFVAVFLSNRSTNNFSEAFLESYSFDKKTNQVFFSFSLSNFEGLDTTYSYKVFFGDLLVSEKSVFVKNTESVLVEETFAAPSFEGEKKVLVKINRPDYQEPFSLFFWVF